MKLNLEYIPSQCTDLNDVKTGIQKLIDFCDKYNSDYCWDILEDRRKQLTFNTPIIFRRLSAYQNKAENFNRSERMKLMKTRFNAFTYFMNLNYNIHPI